MALRYAWVAAVVCFLASLAPAADFTVTDTVLCRDFVGFGGNISPYFYCEPNWPAEINDANVADFEQKVLDLSPQHVRIFVEPQWWQEPRWLHRAQSVERLCRLMDRAGASVNLTLWGGKYDADDMGRRMAALFARLITEQKLTCVRYATLQNEPNGFNMDKVRYATLYKSFDAELKRLGIRDRVKIIGGDLLSDNQVEWFTMLARDLSAVLDGYAVHMYSDYWDVAHMTKRLTEIPPIVAALPPEGRKPLYLMEFGVRGHRQPHEEPGKNEDGRPMYDLPITGTLLAYHVIEVVNRGYLATCQWDLVDVMYDKAPMHYGVIGEAKDGFPLKPCYQVLKLFTHAAGPGWSTLRVDGEKQGVSVAALQSKQAARSVFAVNREPKETALTIGGLTPGRAIHLRIWNADGNGRTNEREPVKADPHGEVSIDLPGMSMLVLTTAAGN